VRRLRLLRLHLLVYLLKKAKTIESVEAPVSDIVANFTKCGASEAQIISCLSFLATYGLMRRRDRGANIRKLFCCRY